MPKPAFTPVRTVICARCGAAFACGLSAECWCTSLPARLPLPDDKTEDCLCPDCLRRAAGVSDSQNTPR
ncbi:MAG TPA: cysteine-rich CWC family protein [Pseudolabrys sp.]|uniref:cysteine-rich CWC family protein n=1 Tax=Pseudolabrys sp. TaxID=1960880 RepID=UPI002DDCFD5D|nr:cysteine-rich CWC family protein [Pseudolabrys sp.]HEV2631248.1 cysteine-rich CWC family protein [Pseudolabrys sp.]